MKEFREQALREIEALRESIRQFKAGEITPEQFRPRRLAYGIYAQLPHTSHMLRIKLPAGIILAHQLEVIADVADKYARGVAHVTTRQDIQFHWVPLEATPDIFLRFLDVGILNRGACSDSIRNVTSCYMAGLCRDESFDVIPYARAISDYFVFHPLNLTLPRKFKIAVSGCRSDCALGSIHEIGAIATTQGGVVEGFTVKAGGGLGSLPHLARIVREFIPKEDLLILCEAIVRVFHRNGERKNRLRARMKFLMKKLGYDEFQRVLDAEYDKVEKETGDELREKLRALVARYSEPYPTRSRDTALRESKLYPESEGFSYWCSTNLVAQRQEGYSVAIVKLPLGDATSDQLRSLARIARELGNGTLRATVSQNLAIPFILNEDLSQLYARLKEVGLSEPDAHRITDVVSCPGADYCSLAITKSMGVGARVREHLKGGEMDVARIGKFRIQISGCPNSCGQHHIGDIGLTGLMVKGSDGVERPHYSILVGGGVTGDNPTLAKRLPGKYPEEITPRIIASIANHYLESRQEGESFKEFAARMGVDYFTQIAKTVGGSSGVDATDPEPEAID